MHEKDVAREYPTLPCVPLPFHMPSQTLDNLGLPTGLQARSQEGGVETEEGSTESHEPGLLNKVKALLRFIQILGVSLLARMRSVIG